MKEIKFDAQTGLAPAVIQDAVSGQVLMLAYMNEESLKKTMETGETWFFSRSRNELWNKGATSGHKQIVKRMPLVFEDHLKCSSGFTWHLPLRKRSTYFVTRIANLVLLYGLRDF